MSKPELIAAIEALGWHGLTSSHEKVTAYHADCPAGWQVWDQPGPGEEAMLLTFLCNVKNAEILKAHIAVLDNRAAYDQQTIKQTLARLAHV